MYSNLLRSTQPPNIRCMRNEYRRKVGKRRQVLRCSRPCVQDVRTSVLAGSKCRKGDELLRHFQGLKSITYPKRSFSPFDARLKIDVGAPPPSEGVKPIFDFIT
jgi:hypothetical protein